MQHKQILANKRWGEKPILIWTPRWPLSGPYSGSSVRGSALTVKVLEWLKVLGGRESFALLRTATATMASITSDLIFFPLT